MRIVLLTMDTHLASACARAAERLARMLPGVSLAMHAAAQWTDDADALAKAEADIAAADLVIATMLFMEDHFLPVLPALRARRDACDAMVCAMCAGEVMQLTRMGRFSMNGPSGGIVGLLKKLRGKATAGRKADGETQVKANAGAAQMRMLRRLPKILRFIPGTAQDVRAYFLTLQYWLAGSEDNLTNLVHALVDRYAEGPRRALRGVLPVAAPVEYPEVGLYHPRATPRITEDPRRLPTKTNAGKPTVGLLLMRSYLLAGNTAHYDGVIAALEARGLRVLPTFATGLDARPAIERFFFDGGRPVVDAVVSLTGFSLVGGPAYNDASAAQEVLTRLDVPYLAAMPVEFQSLAQWQASERGLLPVEATMMVAIPELDGATGAMVFGGRDQHDMQPHTERCDMLAARVAKLVAMRRSERAQRKVAMVVFNFPPNGGSVGTAAFLSVFESLFNVLQAMQREGYTVDLPANADALRKQVVEGNAARFGAAANVHARITTDDHVRREPHLAAIEAQWGPAPGRHGTDGAAIFVHGERFGNVFVGVQPAFGIEGDPMRLLFDRGFAPTHAFSAFYRWLREDFGAHAVLHFGTHGALEFMPGKQAGMAGECWPDRLIADLPNLYLYAANNPSEGTLAKRRSGATLISYLTPSVTEAGLYRGLNDLKSSIDRWRALPPEAAHEQAELATLIQAQAAALDLAPLEPAYGSDAAARIAALADQVREVEYTLIPHGMHVVGRAPSVAERVDLLSAHAQSSAPIDLPSQQLRRFVERLVAGETPEAIANGSANVAALLKPLADADALLAPQHELQGILRALDGRYIAPAPGGDLLRSADVLPAGRNLHGFDPFRIPSAYAVKDGQQQAERLLQRHLDDGHALPESVAIVLWGTDNLKSEGAPIAQALALIGAKPRFDSYGRLAGAELIPLDTLGRPRIDVMMTLSGIFRDLLPLQIRMLAEASFLAASADEPAGRNFVRKHALAWQAQHGGDLETASLRVFGNAEGAYGANVNHLLDSSCWDEEDELAETYTRRKGFAYGRSGRPVRNGELLNSVLAGVELAYQNLDSVEVGVTTIDTYFDTLGGISRAVTRARRDNGAAAAVPVYIGDQTSGSRSGGVVRTLGEQVALETRTRTLNPKWVEGMLEHGYEGVRQIEAHVTNTMGWSATTSGQVQPWVYRQITEVFMLDPAMRERLARLNPAASAKVANRLLEASRRQYWTPDADTLAALQRAGEELEDRLEGIYEGVAA